MGPVAFLVSLGALGTVCAFHIAPSVQVRSLRFSTSLSSTVETRNAAPSTDQRSQKPPSFEREAWERAFETAREEKAGFLEPVEGALPQDLEGTYYRNGPGKFEAGKDRVKHIFDGDGMIAAVTLRDGKAFFRNRFVRTMGLERETLANRRLYRGFSNLDGGLLANALDTRMKNVANTNVILWGKQLLALWEAGPPHQLDPNGLATLGLADMGGAISSEDKISAHPRIDFWRNRLVTFGCDGFKLTLREFNQDMQLVSKREHSLGNLAFMHDFAITDNYAVFFKAPIKMRAIQWMLGLTSLGGALTWDPEGEGEIILIPRHKPEEPVVTIRTPPKFSFHMANAFEDPASGEVVFDMIESDRLDMDATATSNKPEERALWEYIVFEDVPRQRLQRYRVDVPRRAVRTDTITDNFLDFASVAPWVYARQHRIIYSSCSARGVIPGPLQGLSKLDVTTGVEERWFPEPHEFLGEPSFAPRVGHRAKIAAATAGEGPVPAEDDGYIVAFLFNGKDCTSQLVVFDAADITAGPICRMAVGSNVPFGLHGSFYPGVAPSFKALQESCRAAEKAAAAPTRAVAAQSSGGDLRQLAGQLFKR